MIVQYGFDVIKSNIEKIHDSVAFWSGTTSKVDKFEQVARQLKVSCDIKLVLD